MLTSIRNNMLNRIMLSIRNSIHINITNRIRITENIIYRVRSITKSRALIPAFQSDF